MAMDAFRYYAWVDATGWQAICTDYDIAVQGKSREEVRKGLGEAVKTYLEYVAELAPDVQQRFLKRKTPLSVRLSFRGRWAICRIRKAASRVIDTQDMQTALAERDS